MGRGHRSDRRRRGPTSPAAAKTASRRDDRWSWWLLAATITLLATVAAFSSSPGWYVTDNRFEQFWAPGTVISRFPWLWDPSRGLGGVRGELTLIPGSVLAFLGGVGASPAVTERLWHVALLIVAGLGAVAVFRVFRPTIGLEHAVAGLFYAFNPYSAVFLIPSGLFLHYAVAPWLLVAFLRGTTGGDRWLWPAVFALLVAVSGTLDPPGLAYSLLLFVPAGLYLVLVERTASWRSVLAWGVRAGALALVVSAAVLVQLVNASSSLSARLFGTESVEAINKTTSWAESWRGLGFWVSYFPDGTGLLRQQHAGYFEDPLLILATFVPATIGLVVLGWSRWKPRVLMAAFVLVSLVLMVGPFPPEQPMPFGQLLLVLYDQFPILTALRTSYKAGAGLALGVGCLLAAGVAVTCNARRTTTGRAIPVVSALVLIGVVSMPFWTGTMYSSDDRMRQLPSYWSEALEWLDRRPDNTRALILPGTSNTRYRWGSPGDDIFDGLLRRSHMVYTSFPVSTPRAYDLERAIDEHVTSAEYMPGTLAPVARRLGLRYVVVRNDLDWQKIGRPRPAALQALRSDPDLELIAEFGDRGQNTVAPGDRSPAARSEARLHPVEVFRVKDVPEPVRGLSPTPPLLVAGDGNAWFRLAAQGLLNGRGPLRYTAESDDDALKGALAAGSEVVVTDTNRRQVTLLTRFGEMGSYTLAPGADVGREPRDLFQRAGSQSVAVFGDATKINAAGAEEGSGGFEAGSRPANAFDGDESTSWLTGAFEAPVGRSLQVTFDHPETISEVGVSVAGADDGREVIAASVRFPDGSRVPLDLVGGRSEFRIPPRRPSSVEIRIDAVAGDGENAVGFSEITLGDLDLREFIQVPDDLFQAAERSPALARELERAPLRYLFERSQAEGLVDAEQALRRRFRTAGTRSYALSGTLVVDEETPDQVVDLLVGGPAGAATGDAGPGPCTRGIVRLDGDSVPVRRTGPFEELAGGVAVAFSGCDDVDIGPGWHELESGTGVSVDTVALATGQERALTRSPDQPRVAVTDSGRDSYTLQVDAPDGGAVVSGVAYDSGWRAAIDGEDLGPPQPMDAQAAWRLPGPGSHTVEMRYQPQGVYDLALVMSGSGIVLCLWLIGKGRRS